MPRLDVYPMPGKKASGYVVDGQAGLLHQLGTRVVVPLLPRAAAPEPIRELNPVFEIIGEAHVMLTQAIASIPTRELGRPVSSLDHHHEDINRALDILLIGY